MKSLIALGLIFSILPKYGICPYPFSEPYENFSHSDVTLSSDGPNNYVTTTITNTGNKVLDLNYVTLVSNQGEFNYLVKPEDSLTSFILPNESKELTFFTHNKTIELTDISFKSNAFNTVKYTSPTFLDLEISSYENASGSETYEYRFKLGEDTYNNIKDYHLTFFIKASDGTKTIKTFQHAGPDNSYMFQSDTKLDEKTFKIDELHVAKGLERNYNRKNQIIANLIIAAVVIGIILVIGLITAIIVIPIILTKKQKKINKSN